MSTDKPLYGIALMLGFCLMAPLGDAFLKLLGDAAGVAQVVFLRFAFQAAILWPVVLAGRRPWRMERALWGYTLARTLLHIAGIAMVFLALRHLPIADAVAIGYVMPFILLLLGWFFMNEEVGPRRLAACVVGFLGALLVIQPAFDSVGAAALYPLGVAVVFALFMLVTRHIAPRTDPVGMQAVSALMAVALLGPVLLMLPPGAMAWRPLDAQAWRLVVVMGTIGTLAHLAMTWALRYAPASTLAPLQYLEIPCAVVVGWAVFADLPGPLASLGIALTMAAGLYIVMRERAIAAQAPIP